MSTVREVSVPIEKIQNFSYIQETKGFVYIWLGSGTICFPGTAYVDAKGPGIPDETTLFKYKSNNEEFYVLCNAYPKIIRNDTLWSMYNEKDSQIISMFKREHYYDNKEDHDRS